MIVSLLLAIAPLVHATAPDTLPGEALRRGYPPPPHACGTSRFAPRFTTVGPLGHVRGDGAQPRTRASLTPDRDAWGLYPNYRVSEHFIVKWGNTGGVTQDEVAWLLEAFERAWAVEVEEMGHPAPDGTDSYLFNVYIGDTGDGTPGSYGAGGYYNRDDQGYPMIVIARDSLRYAEYVQETAPHEFYHALQDEVASYPYTGASAWYWEATAEWAAGEVLPENDSYAQFLFGYGYLAELSVEFFDYPDEGTLQEYHQYGAFIFPRYLSEVAADRQVIVDSWVRPTGTTPLASIRDALGARGISLADAFGAFAARNATWAYADGAVYQDIIDTYDAYYPGERHEIDEVGSAGTDGLVRPGPDVLPQGYGYNVVWLGPPRDGFDLHVQVDPTGNWDSPAAWRVTVVREDGTVTPVDVSTGVAELTIRGSQDAWLVAAAVPERARNDERFGWAYEVTPAAPEEVVDTGSDDSGAWGADDSADEKPDPTSCGCASWGGGGPAPLRNASPGVALGTLLGMLVARRRRP